MATTLNMGSNSVVHLSRRTSSNCPSNKIKVRIDRSKSRSNSAVTSRASSAISNGSRPNLTIPPLPTSTDGRDSGTSPLEQEPSIVLTAPEGEHLNIFKTDDGIFDEYTDAASSDVSAAGSGIDECLEFGSVSPSGSYNLDTSVCEELIASENSDDEYDTDIEDGQGDDSKFSLKKNYVKMCESQGIVPSSTYMREMFSSRVNVSNSLLNTKDIKMIAASLVNNASIMELNVSGNDIGAQGAFYLAEALSDNVFVTELDISHIYLGKHGTAPLREIVSSLLINRTVTKLNLAGNFLCKRHAVEIGRLIIRNDFITELDLSYNDLDEASGVILANPIATNVSLHYLNLKWNQLRRSGATALIKAISSNVELLNVDLSWNGLGTEGCLAIEETFANNKTLQSLDISHNRISFMDLAHALKGFKKNETLEKLKIQGNPITTDGAVALMKMLENSSTSCLKEIDVTDIPANDNFMECVKALHKKGVVVHTRGPLNKKFDAPKVVPVMKDFDPVLLLFEYMRQEHFRLIDLFRNLDKNQDNTISREEFKEGFMTMNITLTDEGLDRLLEKLDINHNEVVDYTEMKTGHKKASAAIRTLTSGTHGERYQKMIKSIKKLLANARDDKFNRGKSPEQNSGKNSRNPSPNTEKDKTESGKATDKQSKKPLRRRSSVTAVIEVPDSFKRFLTVHCEQ